MPYDGDALRPKTRVPGKIAEVFFDRRTRKWRASRYKVLHGGRGGAKSESLARMVVAVMRAARGNNVLCTRRFQNSISDSVHRTISDAIEEAGLAHEFDIQRQTIIHRRTGNFCLFKGTARSMGEIKSLKGIKYCWIEEAESMPADDWQVLDKTIRVEGSELWISFNPDGEDAPTYQQFVAKPRKDSIVCRVNYYDNPFFPDVLRRLMEADKEAADAGDPGAQAIFDWVWLGETRRLTHAVVFHSRVTVEDFDEPGDVRPFYGADWGFADDPSCLIRSYIDEATNTLYITHEAFAWRRELDDLPALFDEVPGSRIWPIKGDCSRPETISYVARQGFNLTGAEKWPGSVEDGIAHLKAFKRIVVHPRCINIAREFRLYSYKVDPRQLDAEGKPVILPVLVDRHNHGIDALRYAFDGYIQSRGTDRIWERL